MENIDLADQASIDGTSLAWHLQILVDGNQNLFMVVWVDQLEGVFDTSAIC